MRASRYLLPVLKESPQEASIASHQLMLRSGMIRQLASGIYNWLPLGKRVLDNIANIVKEEMDSADAQEILMPTMQPAKLWEESGRGNYGKETLNAVDRHKNALIYGPTNEEVVTDLFRNTVRSYKELPLNLYHVQWKFRDEIRPRFGVMRGREFLMKDAYSFDTDEEAARESYDNMYRAYLRIFRRLGLTAIPFTAKTGQIGGNMSHEFQVVASTGESEIFYDPAFEKELRKKEFNIEKLRSLYSAADEMHDPDKAPEECKSARGIEVGHIFYLGTKYSQPMGANIQHSDGSVAPVHMGCYGIGISRLIGAIIESSHDKDGIIWPESVTPFHVGLINIRPGHEQCDKACEDIYANLQAAGISTLYDDRNESAGAKFAAMALIGLPWQLAIGPRGIGSGLVELKNRKSGQKEELSIESAMTRILS